MLPVIIELFNLIKKNKIIFSLKNLAIALSKATGLNTHLAVFLIYLVCIFYSSQGGMKAVVIADTFQVNITFDNIHVLIFIKVDV